MVVNPDKFQSIIIKRLRKLKSPYNLLTDNYKTDSENSITLLCIEIHNKLNFEKHDTTLCHKANCPLNPLWIIHKYIGFQERKCYLTVLYCQILTNISLYGFSDLLLCHRKKRKYRNMLWGYCIMIATPVTTAYY